MDRESVLVIYGIVVGFGFGFWVKHYGAKLFAWLREEFGYSFTNWLHSGVWPRRYKVEKDEDKPDAPFIPLPVNSSGVYQNPTVGGDADGQKKAEEDESVSLQTIDTKKAELLRLRSLSPAEASGLDLSAELDKASREYGEIYYARYKRAPPEWS